MLVRYEGSDEHVVIPDGIMEIWAYALTPIESVDIPNGVESIDNMAFIGCTSLRSLYIPVSVTEIDWYAFYENTNN